MDLFPPTSVEKYCAPLIPLRANFIRKIGWLALFGVSQLQLSLWASPPVEEDGKIVFQLYNLRFEVDPQLAGRVSSVKLDGVEVIKAEANTPEQRGSTFWPSPQNWPWPPPRALDSEPYAGGIEGDSVVLTSNHDNGTGLTFRKVYKADPIDSAMVILYTMINSGNSATSVGPWAVTRILKSGVSFWPKGEGAATGGLTAMSSEAAGAIWLNWDNPQGSNKIFADGAEGWFAHANSSGQFLIKTFEDTPSSQKAPGENEIEFYSGTDFLEMEHQGPYTELAPGDSLEWEVKWYVRASTDITIEPGNQEILDFVEAVLAPPVTGVLPHVNEQNTQAPRLFNAVLENVSGNGMNIKGQKIDPAVKALIQGQIQVVP